MNEKIHNRAHLIMSVGIVILAAILIYGWVSSGDIRDRMAGLQTQLCAAQESASIAIGQLGELSIDYHGIEDQLGDALVELEHNQEYISDLEREITDAADASNTIGVSIDEIGDFIKRVEDVNKQRTSPVAD